MTEGHFLNCEVARKRPNKQISEKEDQQKQHLDQGSPQALREGVGRRVAKARAAGWDHFFFP